MTRSNILPTAVRKVAVEEERIRGKALPTVSCFGSSGCVLYGPCGDRMQYKPEPNVPQYHDKGKSRGFQKVSRSERASPTVVQ